MEPKTAGPSEPIGLKSVLALAVPISVQSLFQYSLSVIDQIMVGQLGTKGVAAVGLGSNFANVYIVTLTAIGTAASIMIAQYFGAGDRRSVRRTFYANCLMGALAALLFLIPSLAFPQGIIRLYTSDGNVIPQASEYLRIIAPGYLCLLISTMVSALLRNTGKVRIPMATGILSVGMNTLLNYLLIFGKLGLPALGVLGTAVATTATRGMESILLLLYLCVQHGKIFGEAGWSFTDIGKGIAHQTIRIAAPIVLNEFLWGVGTTVYSMIYGRMSTDDLAAMTLTYPVQSLSTGLFSGISAAAAILVGNCLGKNDFDTAYRTAVKIIKGSLIGSATAGVVLIFLSNAYAGLFRVEPNVRQTCVQILFVFSCVLFTKVGNMIIGGGILRCGGKTQYSLYLDLLGTWGIGVPLGLLAAFVFRMDIQTVYLMICMEEAVRLLLEFVIIRSKKWMKNFARPETHGCTECVS